MYTEVIGFITNTGFPIFLAYYLLTSHTKEIKTHTEAINKLTLVITGLHDMIQGGTKNGN